MTNPMMHQVVITEAGGPEKLAIEQTTVPEPKADEVLVQVHAFGLNRPDILQRQGLYPMPKGVTPVPGLEVAGEVVAVGADYFRVFDNVFNFLDAAFNEALLFPGLGVVGALA